jgi:uncharacterized protein YkwD
MQKKMMKKWASVGLSVLLASQFFFVGEAQASWGAAKILELRRQQGNITQPAPTTPRPTTPTPTTPVPSPVPTPQPDPVPTPEPQPAPGQNINGVLAGQEQQMLSLLNAERAKNGLKPLSLMPELTNLARLKSNDIIQNNYFSHTSPVYGSFANMVYNAGIRFYSVGENLAKARNGQHAFVLLMASSGHKANMLNRNFTHVGIGIIQDTYGVVVTQLFIMR